MEIVVAAFAQGTKSPSANKVKPSVTDTDFEMDFGNGVFTVCFDLVFIFIRIAWLMLVLYFILKFAPIRTLKIWRRPRRTAGRGKSLFW
jgi:hypothetical protein